MLTKQDKKWVVDTVTTALAIQTEVLTKVFTVLIQTTINKAINDLRIELTQVIADGFAECASAKEMAEVKANIGSLEQRFAWMHKTMITKDYFDERMRAHTMKEEVVAKQQSQKMARLVHVLNAKKVFRVKEANAILSLQPFPQKLLSK